MDFDFTDGSCPMTVENCEKYHVTDIMAKRFCNEGCSSICGQLFFTKFGKHLSKEVAE